MKQMLHENDFSKLCVQHRLCKGDTKPHFKGYFVNYSSRHELI